MPDALALAVGHRPGSADDVDAVLTRKGAGPAAHHVVVAAVPVMAEHTAGDGIELLDVAAGLAVAGKAEERRVDIGGRDPCLAADVRNTLRERLFHDLETVVEVIGRRRGGAGVDSARVVDERQSCFLTAAVDPEITCHVYSPIFFAQALISAPPLPSGRW